MAKFREIVGLPTYVAILVGFVFLFQKILKATVEALLSLYRELANFLSLAVVDLIRREIVGGATVPHSRASTPDFSQVCYAVLRIRIRRLHMFLGLPDPDPLVRDTAPDPSIMKQK